VSLAILLLPSVLAQSPSDLQLVGVPTGMEWRVRSSRLALPLFLVITIALRSLLLSLGGGLPPSLSRVLGHIFSHLLPVFVR